MRPWPHGIAYFVCAISGNSPQTVMLTWNARETFGKGINKCHAENPASCGRASITDVNGFKVYVWTRRRCNANKNRKQTLFLSRAGILGGLTFSTTALLSACGRVRRLRDNVLFKLQYFVGLLLFLTFFGGRERDLQNYLLAPDWPGDGCEGLSIEAQWSRLSTVGKRRHGGSVFIVIFHWNRRLCSGVFIAIFPIVTVTCSPLQTSGVKQN